MKKVTSYIPLMQFYAIPTSGSSYVVGSRANYYHSTHFTSPTVYFEVWGKTSEGEMHVQLYNKTDGSAVGDAISFTETSLTRKRIAVSLTDGKSYGIQMKQTSGTVGTGIVFKQTLVVVQEAAAITAIETRIGLADQGSGTSASYVEQRFVRYKHDASKFDGTVQYYFQGWQYGSAAGTVSYLTLWDVTAGAAVSGAEISVTGTTPTIAISGALTLVDGHIYTVKYKRGVTGTANYRSAFLIVRQTGAPTKTKILDAMVGMDTTLTSTSFIEIKNDTYGNETTPVRYDSSEFSNVTNSIKVEASLNHSTASAHTYVELYDETGAASVSNSEITNSANSDYEILLSGALALTSGRVFKSRGKVSSATGYVSRTAVVYEVSNLNEVAPTIAANTADAQSFGNDTTPTLEFTGSDFEGDAVTYDVQISDQSDFAAESANFTVNAGACDGSEINNNSWNQGETTTWIGTNGSSQDMDNGFIFPAVNIPKGAVITAAAFHGYGFGDSGSGVCKIRIKGFDEVDAAVFNSDGSNRPSLRAKTTAYVDWEADFPFSFGWRTSTDITTIIQEIVDKAEWKAGDRLGLVLENNGSPAGTTLALEQYDDAGSHHAYLSVTWSFLLEKVSNADDGFINTVDGGDTDPFTAGEKVSFTVQAGEELSPGTYYWRVKAKDPSGSNTYSSWTAARSFTIVPNQIIDLSEIEPLYVMSAMEYEFTPTVIVDVVATPDSLEMTASLNESITVIPDTVFELGTLQAMANLEEGMTIADVVAIADTLEMTASLNEDVEILSGQVVPANPLQLTASLGAVTVVVEAVFGMGTLPATGSLSAIAKEDLVIPVGTLAATGGLGTTTAKEDLMLSLGMLEGSGGLGLVTVIADVVAEVNGLEMTIDFFEPTLIEDQIIDLTDNYLWTHTATFEENPAWPPVVIVDVVARPDTLQTTGSLSAIAKAQWDRGPAFDAHSGLGNLQIGASSWLHTPVGTPRGVCVFISCSLDTDVFSGVTYGGVPMQEVSGSPQLLDNGTQDVSVHAFFLGKNIPTGQQLVEVIVTSEAPGLTHAEAVTLTAPCDCEIEDVQTINNPSITDPTVMLDIDDNSFCILGFTSQRNSASSCTPFAGWTDIYEQTINSTRVFGVYTKDTNTRVDTEAGIIQAADEFVMIAVAITSPVPALEGRGATVPATAKEDLTIAANTSLELTEILNATGIVSFIIPVTERFILTSLIKLALVTQNALQSKKPATRFLSRKGDGSFQSTKGDSSFSA